MFSRFFKKKAYEPLNAELRRFFEGNLLWFEDMFPEPTINNRKILSLSPRDFPVNWDATQDNAFAVMEIVAREMDINVDELHIDFYNEGIRTINDGSSTIFMENDADDKYSSGQYFEKDEGGKYTIAINEQILNNPEDLIGTIAHELCHVKLLGGKLIDENDEHMTDLMTVFFGFGVFGANASFRYFQDNHEWSCSSQGYLSVEEWAYALAVYTYLREEKNPEWIDLLNASVKAEYNRCMEYIWNNEDKLFQFE